MARNLDVKLPRCKARKQSCNRKRSVREDCSFVQQRRRWVPLRSNSVFPRDIGYFTGTIFHHPAAAHDLVKIDQVAQAGLL